MRLERLREWRESRGLTQRELASEADVGEVTVARAEAGISVRPNTAHKMANVMGVAVADLMERPPVPLGEAPQEPGQSGQEWAREQDARLHGMTDAEWTAHVRSLGSEKEIEEEYRALTEETKMLHVAHAAYKWQHPEDKDRRAALSRDLRDLRTYRLAELAAAAKVRKADALFREVVQAMDDVAV